MQHGEAEHISGSDLRAHSAAISDLAITDTLAAPDRDAHQRTHGVAGTDRSTTVPRTSSHTTFGHDIEAFYRRPCKRQ